MEKWNFQFVCDRSVSFKMFLCSKTYSEPRQTSKKEGFARVVNGL